MSDHEPDEPSLVVPSHTDAASEAGDFNPTGLGPVEVHTPDRDPNRILPLLATSGLALTILAGIELLLTIALGLAVEVNQLSRVARVGYAFLTQLEKSPLGLLLVVAAIVTAVAAKRAEPNSATERRTSLAAGLIIGFAVVLAMGSVLAIVARFNVADLVETQKIDGVTRRVLAIFLVRNLGAAVVALYVAGAAVRPRPRA